MSIGGTDRTLCRMYSMLIKASRLALLLKKVKRTGLGVGTITNTYAWGTGEGNILTNVWANRRPLN